jgi:hypothetical protein
MKRRPWLIAGAALLASGCGMNGGNQFANGASGQQGGGHAPAATLAFAAQGCAATWNGAAVTPQAVTDKGTELMAQAVRTAGGASRMQFESLPVVRIEGAASLAWSCAGPYVAALGRSSVALVDLAGDSGPPARLGLPIPNMPPPEAAIAIGAHAYRWNGATIDSAALDRQFAGIGAAPDEVGPGAELPPPGLVRLEPGPDATLADILVPARAALRYHLPPDLAAEPADLPAPVTPGGPPLPR